MNGAIVMDYIHAVVEAIKDGKGYPKLLNDEMVIPFYLANGVTRKEANDWNISGCCENRALPPSKDRASERCDRPPLPDPAGQRR